MTARVLHLLGRMAAIAMLVGGSGRCILPSVRLVPLFGIGLLGYVAAERVTCF